MSSPDDEREALDEARQLRFAFFEAASAERSCASAGESGARSGERGRWPAPSPLLALYARARRSSALPKKRRRAS